MGLGCCPVCGTTILSSRNGLKPLGNYREVKIVFDDSSRMRIPYCLDCHDAIEGSVESFPWKKIVQYIEADLPSEWDVKKKKKFMDALSSKNISSVTKLGTLKIEDLENGSRVWR